MSAIKRFKAELATAGVDGALISSQINIRYLCGFNFTDGYLLIFNGKNYLLTDSRYSEAAKDSVKNFDVVIPTEGMLKKINELCAEHSATVIAIEDGSVTLAEFSRLREALPDVTLSTGATDILKELREIKSEEELEKIKKAQAITDKAFEHILGFITPECTEAEVAIELEMFMRRQGAEGVAFDTIAVSGKSSSLPHGVPSYRQLSKGFLTMDFGAKLEGYCSDMTRTVVIGRADEDMKKIYATVLSAQEAALEAICEGMRCSDADKIARDVIKSVGFGDCFGHGLGHGVGLYIHESPSLSPRAKDTSVLRRGNVVTVEPGIYVEGKYGCRIEDMIAVDHGGKIVNFTKSPKNLIEL